MTDIEKYKSVAIKIETYKKAKPIAAKNYMSLGSFIRYLIDKECAEFEHSKQTITGEKNASYTN